MASSTRLRRRTQAPKPIYDTSRSQTRKIHCDSSDSDDDVYCEKCGSGESPAELLLCDQCDGGYHIFCLRPILPSVPKGFWFCSSCSNQRKPKPFSQIQTKILDFFRVQRPPSEPLASQECQKKRKRSSSLAMSKKKRRLLAYTPSEDPERRLQQMRSLATALTASGTEFSDQLTYYAHMVSRSANCPALEKGGMQTMSKEDIVTLNLCKRMMDRGECPPLMVVFDPLEGFTVEADKFIKDLTIITEYTGDIDYLKNRENDDGDSTMILLSAINPSQSLVICPYKRGNIARFISGINNHTIEGKKKQNLKCVRYNVNGECRVLLVANRDISKGERLYYDYNGDEHEYPTEHFV